MPDRSKDASALRGVGLAGRGLSRGWHPRALADLHGPVGRSVSAHAPPSVARQHRRGVSTSRAPYPRVRQEAAHESTGSRQTPAREPDRLSAPRPAHVAAASPPGAAARAGRKRRTTVGPSPLIRPLAADQPSPGGCRPRTHRLHRQPPARTHPAALQRDAVHRAGPHRQHRTSSAVRHDGARGVVTRPQQATPSTAHLGTRWLECGGWNAVAGTQRPPQSGRSFTQELPLQDGSRVTRRDERKAGPSRDRPLVASSRTPHDVSSRA